MNIKELASEFTVFIFSQDADLGSRIKFTLSSHKFETYFFSDFDEMFLRLESSPPHILIIDYSSLIKSLSDVFQSILKISAEVRFICLADVSVLNQLGEYYDYNMVQCFDRDQQAVVNQIRTTVEQTCEALYRLYQSEQVYNIYKDTVAELETLKVNISKKNMGPAIRPFQMRITEYRTAENKEDLIQIFFKQAPMQSWAFLKYVKSIQTYVSVSSQNLPGEWVEGLSYKVLANQLDFNDKIIVGIYSDSFLDYIKSKWEVNTLKILPLIHKNEVEGLFISPQEISAEIAEDFALMSIVYSLISLESQTIQLDVEDTLTGLYNQLFYTRILEKEIDRSKRSFKPVSLIKISVDIFREIEVSQGRLFCDEIIKSVAEIIKQSSRLSDYICRTDDNEFSIILTNCNRKGAVLRAERIRQQLKAVSFSKTGFAVTVSQGISEYPSLTNTLESLNDSAHKALQFITSKGGDKICIYKAPQNHEPDFEVNK